MLKRPASLRLKVYSDRHSLNFRCGCSLSAECETRDQLCKILLSRHQVHQAYRSLESQLDHAFKVCPLSSCAKLFSCGWCNFSWSELCSVSIAQGRFQKFRPSPLVSVEDERHHSLALQTNSLKTSTFRNPFSCAYWALCPFADSRFSTLTQLPFRSILTPSFFGRRKMWGVIPELAIYPYSYDSISLRWQLIHPHGRFLNLK